MQAGAARNRLPLAEGAAPAWNPGAPFLPTAPATFPEALAAANAIRAGGVRSGAVALSAARSGRR